ncbi:hypothetical protein HYS72_01985 [Candidatus Pacearchaeota archaeon]|nr:hypothetical protein [Candidatus Pacearchaeota archaeon]
MKRKELIKKYIEFFKSKDHKEIPNSSLVPQNDPTVLFTTAGMHPLVPFLLGQKHPLGKKLCGIQRCIRTGDIEEVGDETHHTFFEMLGNWSFGDYWKKQAIEYSFEFLTKILKIPKEKLEVSCFKGDKDSPKDLEAEKIWKSLGIKKIKFLGKEDNWWGPAGETGPCGPDTEMFVNSIEIWNDVFMEYEKIRRVILVDGMNCVYDENFKPNKELLDIINKFNQHYVLVVNKFREKGINVIKNYDSSYDTNWIEFSLEEIGVKKDNEEYFKKLLAMFNPKLNVEDIIYFDHKKENVETAKSFGITAVQYENPNQIKNFIENNLYKFLPAKQKNIDTGMGVERTISVLNNLKDNYLTDCFKPIIEKIESLSGKKYNSNKETTKAMRIIADHIKASVFIIADGVLPSNKEQGYVLRRLIRRAVRYGNFIGLKNFIVDVSEPVFEIYKDYKELKDKKRILKILTEEEQKFNKTIEQGEKELMKVIREIKPSAFGLKNKDKKLLIDGKTAFLLYQSYGFPLEFVQETAERYDIKVDKKEFEDELQKHQELSKTASAGKFKSGLADTSEKTTKLHTATHLLNEALRIILSKDVKQRGSNITSERLRFDFSFDRKLTLEEIKKIEELVNKKIKENIEVAREEMPLKKAFDSGAQGEFGAKYPEKVSVYSIGNFSKEICTGPHVKNTKELGKFKIIKEESSSAGVRRIKAALE